jgi:hypothetical protein
LVVVRIREDHLERVEILNDEGAVDRDERMAAWRAEGWTGGIPSFRETGLIASHHLVRQSVSPTPPAALKVG